MNAATRPFAATTTALFLSVLASCAPPVDRTARFDVVEATIPEMQAAMAEGIVTSRELVEAYLVRIAMYEEGVNATMEVNPRALEIADSLDRERAAGQVRGPLHGIPVALKDIIHTTDMHTTGGALAFEGFTPPYNELTKLQRLEFYDKAREPDTALIIATGDQRNWANLLLTMGFIKHPEGKGDY